MLCVQIKISKSWQTKRALYGSHYITMLIALLIVEYIFNKIKNLLETTSILKPSEDCSKAMVKIH